MRRREGGISPVGAHRPRRQGRLPADLADRIEARAAELLEANRADVEAGREEGLNEALLDRLDADRGADRGDGRRASEIAVLEDPVGEVVERRTLESGLELEQQRVPIGVVADRLRGAAERHHRRRGALPEERQRGPAPRFELAPASNAALGGLIARGAVAEAGLPERRRRCSSGGDRGSWRAGHARRSSWT